MNSLKKARTRVRLQFIAEMRRLGVIHGIVESDGESSEEQKTQFHNVINLRREEIKAETYNRLQLLS